MTVNTYVWVQMQFRLLTIVHGRMPAMKYTRASKCELYLGMHLSVYMGDLAGSAGVASHGNLALKCV